MNSLELSQLGANYATIGQMGVAVAQLVVATLTFIALGTLSSAKK